jgi:DNA-binding MarR family transcriptional regulator
MMDMSMTNETVRADVLPPEAEEAWRGMLRVTRELTRRLGEVIQEASGLSPQDFDVLVVLLETDGRTLRSSELAAVMEWDRSRLSHHAGRLERRGLLLREACPEDNRGVRFRISESGVAAIRTATGPHFRAARRLFADGLTADQIAQLIEITGALSAHLAASGDPGTGAAVRDGRGTPDRA